MYIYIYNPVGGVEFQPIWKNMQSRQIGPWIPQGSRFKNTQKIVETNHHPIKLPWFTKMEPLGLYGCNTVDGQNSAPVDR